MRRKPVLALCALSLINAPASAGAIRPALSLPGVGQHYVLVVVEERRPPARVGGHAPVRHARRPPAQSRAAPKPAPAPPAAAAAPEPPPPPYDPQLQRLAEIMGGLAYLRDLCGDGDGDDWREKLARLREADAQSGPRRERLTASFNRGFRGYELTYHACTPNARLAISRYLGEADRIARDVTSHYGDP